MLTTSPFDTALTDRVLPLTEPEERDRAVAYIVMSSTLPISNFAMHQKACNTDDDI